MTRKMPGLEKRHLLGGPVVCVVRPGAVIPGIQ